MFSKDTLRYWLPFLFVLLTALCIRCWTLPYGTNVDEGDYLMQGREWSLGHWPYGDLHLNKPPLVSTIALPFFLVDDAPIIPIRLFIIALSMASIIAVYYIGNYWVNEKVGLLAAGLYALDPLTAIWAKYLHVSTLAPIFSSCALAFCFTAFQKKCSIASFIAGIITSFCFLNKQTGALILPVIAWLFFIKRNDMTKRNLLIYLAGLIPFPLMLLIMLLSLGAMDNFLYDVFWGNIAMSQAFHFTLQDRWLTFRAFMHWNPLLWWGVVMGSIAMLFKRDGLGLVIFAWFLLEFAINLFALSHVWKHYILAIVPAAALITAYGLNIIICELTKRFSWKILQTSWLYVLLAFLITIPFWSRANWTYPNITLQDERALAAQIKRRCSSSYLLCFANSTFYILADKLVPPAIRDDEQIRIPPFMNTAARHYLTREEMRQTADHWRELPIDYCVMYGKYAHQIFVERDPLLKPIRIFLEQEFEQAPELRLNRQTYMATLYCFKRKQE